MRIGELAARAGVSVQTVRYYEKRGLMPSATRLASGYREFDDGAIDRLLFVRRAQELGFTLNEIGELLSLRQDEETTADDVKRRALAKVTDIDEKMRDLRRIRHALVHLAGECRGGHGPPGECPLLDALGPIGT